MRTSRLRLGTVELNSATAPALLVAHRGAPSDRSGAPPGRCDDSRKEMTMASPPVRWSPRRRAVLGAVALAAIAPIVVTRAADAATKRAATPAPGSPPFPTRPLWKPSLAAEGIRAFEGIEVDRGNTNLHP